MILAILQARASSTRLPGKVLKPILGEAMLYRQLERLRRAKSLDALVVATSTHPSDDPIESLCKAHGIAVFRGSLEDVLDRFHGAAKGHNPDHVVRLTGDCPLVDPALLDQVVARHLEGGFDYTSNAQQASFPDGLDVEVLTWRSLEEAWREAKLPSQREHVTPFVAENPARYRIGHVVGERDLSHLRWTVDEPEDFELVDKIYTALYPKNAAFTTADILAYLDQHPELKTINRKFERNEGYARSLLQDKGAPTMGDLSKSLAMQDRGKKRIPGMTQLLSKRPDVFSLGVWPGYYSKAKGAEVWDLDGNKYVDMSIGGIGANVLGYADPDVDGAVVRAITDGSSSSLNCAEEVELADLLCEIHPWADMARYARTGGEAMAVAVRIARAHTGRDVIAFCGYHGWHDWYLAANVGTENALGEHLIPGLAPTGVPKSLKGTALPFRYNQLDELKAIVAKHKNELAAIVMEPIRNDDPVPGFLDGVRALANEAGAVLVIDEISAGFRLNSGGAHLKLGLTPDVAVFSKALGNGYPIAAVIGKGAVMDTVQKTFISSTNWTERVGPTAAIATIRKHRAQDASKHLIELGKRVQAGWTNAGQKAGLKVHAGGIYPMSHFEIEGGDSAVLNALFVQLMLERGFLASTSFYSMLAHTSEQVSLYLAAVAEAFKEIAAAQAAGDAAKRLKGKPAVSGFKRLI
jgi:glutamate-1-semialdehyde 2,1-aminomutase